MSVVYNDINQLRCDVFSGKLLNHVKITANLYQDFCIHYEWLNPKSRAPTIFGMTYDVVSPLSQKPTQ